MASWNDSADDKNPCYLFSLTHTELLTAIVNGELDPVDLAVAEMVNRGLDKKGKWVGFDKSARLFGIKEAA